MKILNKINSILLKLVNTSCDKVLLCHFIECTKDKNYNILKRMRFMPIPNYILKRSWSILFEEYCSISKNPGYEQFYESMQNVYRLDAKILAISACVKALSIAYDEICVDVLKSFGYAYKFDFSNKKEYINDLNRVIGKSKTIIAERDKEKQRVESLGKTNKSEESAIEYFESSLIMLSKYMGYHVDNKKIVVSEFCRMVVSYEKEIEHLTNKK